MFETVYSSPECGMIVSASKETRDGRVTMFDFERMEVRRGRVVMTPYPNGKASVSFTLDDKDHDPKKRRAVFVNLKHDFPKRFTYERVADDRLVITLDAGPDAAGPSFRFDLQRR